MSRSGGIIIAFLLVPLVIGGCSGNLAVSEVQIHLFAGWLKFLFTTLPNVQVDLAAVATGVACLIALAVGGHWFLSWLYAASDPTNAPYPAFAPRIWQIRWTAYVVTLTVVAFAAGVSAVGITHQTTWLVNGRGR